MPTLTKDEHTRAAEFVQEFSHHAFAGELLPFECIYRSHDFAETRMVLKVQAQAQSYALKIDTESPGTGRLQKEFDVLTALSAYFAPSGSSQVVQPLYLSPGHAFFVTEFVDRPTAVDLIHNSPNNDQIAQIYRRAGSWLHDLHGFQPAKEYGFRPRWMTDSIRELSQSVPRDILLVSQPFLATLEDDLLRLKGISETQVFSHGDFHGENLIVGQGDMIGLDFTEVREKLAVYDIVDFLKSDIFRDGSSADVDRSGILTTNKDMFFRRYKHPVHMGILDFCIRARLLKDWLALWQIDHSCSAFEEDRRHRLEQRLRIAFSRD
ncbi:phosphotransferase family protein [Ruegeria halocynthiae]|uniref:phosphotransferase family protein n=1 Tax=Ruegeria halocynthiae TaxID=985054 RepID=UPI00055F8674|nr:aminoglycoside phosphotransferase family protein [Ruegeria halocynthiae]